ncbi:hypothetical protein EV580_1295 [Mycobacterium sp. BK086]|uniref:hypothetical protein n=1 Tax=Mycobacterium sp. BK086 TaxID=2512165 RepID=UPI00105DFCD0|nr:hypothetical protein [Mycobacterium sp. BK086]TDO18113.1 hypothetical protein EV580_1295 [Mycobacterium sp. BK086]
MTTPVQTAGPVDPNAPTRTKTYAVLAVIFPLIGALATFGVLSADQANAITGFGTAAMGLAGAFGFGFVANKTNKQVKNGTFDAPPPPPPAPELPPAMSAVQSVQAVSNAFTDFSQSVAQGVQLVQGVAAAVPGLSAVVAPGGLVDQFLRGKTP